MSTVNTSYTWDGKISNFKLYDTVLERLGGQETLQLGPNRAVLDFGGYIPTNWGGSTQFDTGGQFRAPRYFRCSWKYTRIRGYSWDAG